VFSNNSSEIEFKPALKVQELPQFVGVVGGAGKVTVYQPLNFLAIEKLIDSLELRGHSICAQA
jgi:Fe2+ or Zn2+ uptake regulation protein